MSGAIEAPRCAGDHYFENICNACGGAQPDGPCEICPHMGVMMARMFGLPASESLSPRAEHFNRRPCRHCGSSDLRTVRVRAAEEY